MRKQKLLKQVIHERAAGKHRIVIINGDSQQVGPWADNHQLAELNGFQANATMDYRGLPVGVFKIVNVMHQVLS